MCTFRIVQLSGTVLMQCPACGTVHTEGELFVEVCFEDDTYVHAELRTCCGDPQPVVVLFDSHEPAEIAINELREKTKTRAGFFHAPLIRKAHVPGL